MSGSSYGAAEVCRMSAMIITATPMSHACSMGSDSSRYDDMIKFFRSKSTSSQYQYSSSNLSPKN